MLRRFHQRWGIELNLPRALHTYVEGQVLQWRNNQIQQLASALEALRHDLIRTAAVRYIFAAQDLRNGSVPHHGIAYELVDQDELKWVGLHAALFAQQRDERESYLQVSLLQAVLLEEIVHVWDYRLEAAGSPYASSSVEWLRVECDLQGRPRPFNIPNRKDYDLIAEDWASAILWYVWQPNELRWRSPERCAFVERLFQRYL